MHLVYLGPCLPLCTIWHLAFGPKIPNFVAPCGGPEFPWSGQLFQPHQRYLCPQATEIHGTSAKIPVIPGLWSKTALEDMTEACSKLQQIAATKFNKLNPKLIMASATKSGAMIGHFGPFRLSVLPITQNQTSKKKVPVERQKGNNKWSALFAVEAECRDKPNEWQVKVLDPAHFLLDVCPQSKIVLTMELAPAFRSYKILSFTPWFLPGSYATSSCRTLMLYNFTPLCFKQQFLQHLQLCMQCWVLWHVLALCPNKSTSVSVPRQRKIVNSKEQIGILRVGTIKLLHSLSASVEQYGTIVTKWVCLKIVYPIFPMVNDHYPY